MKLTSGVFLKVYYTNKATSKDQIAMDAVKFLSRLIKKKSKTA